MYEQIASAASNLVGAGLNYAQGQQNAELQKQFAKFGVRWKVADAQAAGIHPLYALGAQTHSFAPISTGDVGSGIAAAGQNLGAAIDATRTQPEKIDAYTASLRQLQLRKGELENTLLASQIAQMNAPRAASGGMAAAGDPFLMTGQANSGLKPGTVTEVPLKRVMAMPGSPHQEGGAVVDTGFARTTTGWAPVPGKDIKERIEDSFIPELSWAIRNQLVPTFTGGTPPFKAPPGKEWRYNILMQEYQLVSSSRSRPRSRYSRSEGMGSFRNP